jgi:hypothetical protein
MASTPSNRSILREAALTRGTRSNYNQAIRRFVVWAKDRQFTATSSTALDALVARYMDWLYANGGGKHEATNTLYGILHILPNCKWQMYESSLRLRGWNRLKPTRSYPPMLWELAVVISMTMIKQGEINAGLATLLAFDAYLRINEFCNLMVSDIASAGDSRLGTTSISTKMALRLRHTKTGKDQFVQVKRDNVSRLIAQHTNGHSGHELVFQGLTDWRYRSTLYNTLQQLQIEKLGFVPHSLRHGSAVLDLLQGDTIEQVMYRGRWRKVDSARTYLQSGRALLLAVQVPAQLVTLGGQLANNLILAVSTLTRSPTSNVNSRS